MPAPARYLRTLRILHLALCAGVVIFGAAVIAMKQSGSVQPVFRDEEPVLLAVAGAVVMSATAASVLLFRRRLDAIRSMATLDRKLAAYQTAQVIRWALAEGPAMLVIVLMLLTSSPLFIAFAALPLVYLFGSRPPASVEQACGTMNISWEDRQRWEQGQ